MKTTIAALLWLSLTGCSTFNQVPSVSVSIEDLEGFGNPDIDECQITLGGEVPMVPCVVEVNLEWELSGTGLL
jgi:hypothetical protein